MKRLFFLVFVIISLLISKIAFAAPNPNDFDYIITVDDTVTITGYHGNRQKVEIPSEIEDCPVTAIAENAFSPNASTLIPYAFTKKDTSGELKKLNGNKMMVKVIVPDSVTYIGAGAFADCSNLSEIHLPKNLSSINEYTFYRCRSLEHIVLPDSVESIGLWAFVATALSEIVIPDSVMYIGDKAFSSCKQLKSVTFPNHPVQMGNRVFSYALAPDKIPEWMTKIGNTFESCHGLTTLTVPASEGNIAKGAFLGCDNLRTVIIAAGVTGIERSAFSQCDRLEEVIIENGLTHIGDYVFWRCPNLKTIHIPASVTSIGKEAFDECEKLERIIVPANSWAAQNLKYLGDILVIQ